jgi:3-phosphoshikimate 1-carboxyvinyltransferase
LTDLIVKKTNSLSGTVKAPPSKAYSHRAIIASSLSEGLSEIKNVLICDDTLATIDACILIGAKIKRNKDTLRIYGRKKPLTPNDIIDCRESASTIRFITPVCSLADGNSALTGGKSLGVRPIKPLLDALNQLGVQCYSKNINGNLPIIVFGGGIRGGKASIRGDISSQFISGLLFSTPLAKNDSTITLSTPLQSKPYINITLEVLENHGVSVQFNNDLDQFYIPSGQKYRTYNHEIEGDYSSVAFLLGAAVATNSSLQICNLKKSSIQGDRMIINILKNLGVKIKETKDIVEIVSVKENLKPLKINLQDYPDLFPICAVLLSFAKGKSEILGIERLRYKESDRVVTLTKELKKLGVSIKIQDNRVEIQGGKKLYGAKLSSHGDHRIAMACTVAALKATGSSVILGFECINKSYPKFIKDLQSVGGKICEQ